MDHLKVLIPLPDTRECSEGNTYVGHISLLQPAAAAAASSLDATPESTRAEAIDARLPNTMSVSSLSPTMMVRERTRDHFFISVSTSCGEGFPTMTSLSSLIP